MSLPRGTVLQSGVRPLTFGSLRPCPAHWALRFGAAFLTFACVLLGPEFAAAAPVTVNVGNLTTIPVVLHAGDKVTIQTLLTSSDPDEAAEGENLVVRSSAGFYVNLPPDGLTRNYTYIAKVDGETMTAQILGYDNDETGVVTVDVQAADGTAKLTVIANPTAGGTVTGAGSFAANFSQQISATPFGGWEFTQWTDGSTDNPRTVQVPAAGVSYTAVFQQEGKITVEFKYGSDTQPVYFLNGISLPVTFNASSTDPTWTSFEWSVNGGDWHNLGAKSVFNVGSWFGVGGTLKARGISSDGTQHSEPYTVKFGVIPVPPGLSTSGMEVDEGLPLKYSHSSGSFSAGYLGSNAVGIDALLGKPLPFFGGFPFDVDLSFDTEVTVWGNGFATGATLSGSGGKAEAVGVKQAMKWLKKTVTGGSSEVDKSLGAGLNWTWDPSSVSWGTGGSLYPSISWTGETPPAYFLLFDVPAYVKGTLEFGLQGEIDIKNVVGGGALSVGGSVTFLPAVTATFGVGINHWFNVEVFAKGEGNLRGSWNPTPHHDAFSADVHLGVKATALIWSREYTGPSVYHWPQDSAPPPPDSLPAQMAAALSNALQPAALSDLSAWQLMPRTPSAVSSAPAAEDVPAPPPPSLSFNGTSGEIIMQANCFPQSQPALIAAGGLPVLFSIIDDANRSSANRTKLVWNRLDAGGVWSSSAALADDGTGDFLPAVAALPSGQLLIGWQNNGSVLPDTAALADGLAAQEISAARLDPVTGATTTAALTNNALLDHSPSVAAAGDGTAFIAWIQNASNDMYGSAAMPNQILCAFYTGGAWQQSSVAATNLGAITQLTTGYLNGKPTVLLCRDLNDDLTTSTDQELYSIQFNGSAWGAPQMFTNDALQDSFPQLVNLGGQQFALWLHDGQLWQSADLNLANASAVPTQGVTGFNEFAACSDALGRIYVATGGITSGAAPGIFAFQRGTDGTWNAPVSIANDSFYKRSIACAADNSGDLILAYNKVQLATDVAGNPTPGEIDLAAYQLLSAADLSISSLQMTPAQPSVGISVQLSATVANGGLTATGATTVAFVLRHTGSADVALGSAALSAMAPGAQTTVSMTWTAAASAAGDQIVAIVDPTHILSESNTSNQQFAIQPFIADLNLSAFSMQIFDEGLQQASVTIQNTGLADVPAGVTLSVFLAADSGPILASKTLSVRIPAGGSVDDLLQWNASALFGASSTTTVHVVVDPASTIVEYSKGNNSAGGIVTTTGSAVTTTFASGSDLPVTAASFDATGLSANLTLGYAPVAGTILTVVQNRGLNFIQGRFSNLAQGQLVALSYAGISYQFVANYYGGTGNDLVLQWANTRPVAWGYNGQGQLGNNSTTQSVVPTAVNTAGVLAGKIVIAEAAGYEHSVALCSDGTLAAWGYNAYGQLGNNSTTDSKVPAAVILAGTPLEGKTVVAVSAGASHTLALCSDGTVAAWGFNSQGQLGNSATTTTSSSVPVAVNTEGVLADKTVVAISAGQYHSLALCSDGTLAAWGSNSNGQLGNNSTTGSSVPVAVDMSGVLQGKSVVDIATGASHCMVLSSDGTVAAWGLGGQGQLGNGSTAGSYVPAMVSTSGVLSGRAMTAVTAGAYHSLALGADGKVAAWGYSNYGQLGNNSTSASNVPVAVTTTGALSGRTVIALAAGGSFSMAQCSDGTAVSWGYNTNGQLGNNSTSQSNVPVIVNVSFLAAGERLMSTVSGQSSSHALGLVAGPASYPQLGVQQPVGTNLTSGGSSVDMGSSPVGTGVTKTFTLSNKGNAPLTIAAVNIDGVNAADFVLTTPPATTLAAGAGTTLVVTFTPAAVFNRRAALHIVSNDPYASSFDITLNGTSPSTLAAGFGSAADVPVTAAGLTAAGSTINFALNYAPMNGTNLTVIQNTGPGFIQGVFTNLAQGQAVALNYGGVVYRFVANYYGGNGNDLMLQWAWVRTMAWGANNDGQLGNNSTSNSSAPVAVNNTGVLAGRTVVAMAGGQFHSIALCSDGTLATWGAGDDGQLGNGSYSDNHVPVAVSTTGTVLAGKTVVAVAAGDAHCLVLCSDGTLAAWGFNFHGELGNGGTSNSNVPVAVSRTGPALAGKAVVAVAVGQYHNLVLCADGTMAAWGFNGDGELGNNSYASSTTPVAVGLAGKSVVAVTAGNYHSMALCSDGTIAAWGYNNYGQLGNGSTFNSGVPVMVDFTGVLAGKTVAALVAGGHHNLALCTDGSVAAWGYNFYGQLGNSSTTNSSVPVRVNATGLLAGKTVKAVSAGQHHSLAQCADGTAAAWGWNTSGQLGSNSTAQSSVPVAVSPAALVTGERFAGTMSGQSATHSLGLVASPPAPPQLVVQMPAGTTLTSGGGVGDMGSSPVGVPVSNTFTLANIGSLPLTITGVTIDGANSADFAVTTAPASTVAAGTGTTTMVVTFTPAAVFEGSAVLHIASNDPATSQYNVALSGSCPGALAANYFLGSDIPLTTAGFSAAGSTVNLSLSYAPMTGTTLTMVKNTGLDFIQGRFSNLAQGQLMSLSYNGTTYRFVANYYGGSGNDLVLQWADTLPTAWGYNGSGQLGNSTTTSSNVPVAVTTTGTALAGKTVIAASTGYDHALALCSDGTVLAWGYNGGGQLGNGSTTASSVPVVAATAGKTVIAVSASSGFSLALCADGTMMTWGKNNFGQLGNNGSTSSLLPAPVFTAGTPLAGKTVVAVSSGQYHSLALCSDGTVAAWGFNSSGQLGNGTTLNSNVPVAVTTAGTPLERKKVVSVTAGYNHSLALCSDGTVAAWGYNYYGQLGNGTTTNSSLPVAVTGAGTALAGTSVAALAAGQNHSLALLSGNGQMAAWGYNSSGQLGNNSTSSSSVPVFVTLGVLNGKSIQSVAAGASHSMAWSADSVLAAWGDNSSGQLGIGNTTPSPVPVAVNTALLAGGARFLPAVSGATSNFSLGLLAAPPAPQLVVQQPAGTNLTSGGAPVDMGSSTVGASVSKTFTLSNAGSAPLAIAGVTIDGVNASAFAITTGPATTLAAGTGTTTMVVTFTPAAVFDGSAVLHITSNDPATSSYNIPLSGSCAGTLSGTYVSAGSVVLSTSGFNATGSTMNVALGFAPVAGTNFTVVKNTGQDFIQGRLSNVAQGQIIALSYDGNIYNFVANYYGGSGNDLVLQWAGTRPLAWGANTYGQLGNNTSSNSSVPVAVTTAGTALAGKTVIAEATGYQHSLTLCSDGTVTTWGYNNNGQLGNNSTTNSSLPVAVSTTGTPLAGKTVVAVAAGYSHSLALCSDGTLAAWGYNAYGQLGNNSTPNSSVPVAVLTAGTPLAGKVIIAVAAGDNHSLAVCSDGTVCAWGYNNYGQLGNGSSGLSKVPVAVTTAGTPLAGKPVVAVAAGNQHSLAVCSDGTTVAWGYNGYGQLGNNTTTNTSVPVAVSIGTVLGGRTVVALAAGYQHSLALCSDGTVAAWGYNYYGQLGNNSTTQSAQPVAVNTAGVLAGKTVTSISAGVYCSMAACSDGTLAAWGYNYYGQLGNNSTSNSSVPTAVSTTSLAAGERFLSAGSSEDSSHFLGLVAAPPAPQLVVQQPAGTSVNSDGAGVSVGSSPVGVAVSKTFTLKNTGTAPLTISGVTIDGTNSSEFVVTTPPGTSLVAGSGTTTMVVTFTPTGGFSRSAVLHITSNDPTTSPFNVPLSGTCTGSSTLGASFGAGTDVGVTASSFSAAGKTVNLALNYAPQTGTNLLVVQNTGLGFIQGAFNNLAQGQAVTFSYGGINYNFVATYFGGTGNDLVLQWAGVRAVAWGWDNLGQLGNNNPVSFASPIAVMTAGTALAGKTVTQMSGGLSHSVALCSDGTVAAWGANGNGQLGNNSTTDSAVPVQVNMTGALAGKVVTAVSAGYYHSVALCSDGTVVTWGYNLYGQLGNNSTTSSSVPVAVSKTGTALAGKTVVSVSAGNYQTVALCSDGTIGAWGYNFYGQLGNNSTTSSSVAVTVDLSGVLASKTVAAVFTGGYHSVALCSDGTVAAWGFNAQGQLGNNSTTNSSVPVVVSTSGILAGKVVKKVTAGYEHTLALCSDGTLAAWGSGGNGQLGNSSNSNNSVPVAVFSTGVLAGKTVVALSAGQNHSMAQCSDGTMVEWGSNTNGQLGTGTFTSSNVPVMVNVSGTILAGRTLAAVTAGQYHSLALCTDGTVAAWGYDFSGQLGDNNPTSFSAPVAMANSALLTGKTIIAESAGYQHSVVLCSDGTVLGWGYNGYGQLGNNSSSNSGVPVAVNTAGALLGKTVVSVVAGQNHTLALCSDGTVAGWGNNGNGQLGNNSTTNSSVPVAVTTTGTALAGKTVVAIAAGSNHSVALCSDGTVAAWGYNNSGQLGNNSTTQSLVPVAVYTGGLLSGKTVVALAVGGSHNVALCSNGTLAAWGYNGQGELGNGNNSNNSVPVTVSTTGILAGRTVTAIAAGNTHSVVLCSDGTLAAWGYNGNGQLGNNTTTNSNIPVAVSAAGVLAGKSVRAVSAGINHTVVICADGTAAAWGQNLYGQLGNNSFADSSVPVAVSSASLAAGERFVLATSGESASHSLGLVASRPTAKLGVQQPVGTNLISDGAGASFGSTPVGLGVSKTFTLTNTGSAPLTIAGVTIDGTDGSDFAVTTPPASTVAATSGTATMVVTFAPGTGGSGRSAVLHVASNDPATSSFNVALSGICTGAATLDAAFAAGTDVSLTAGSFNAASKTVNLALGYAPLPGTDLMVVQNTGLGFIQGAFSNLAQGQTVTLSHGGTSYRFVANYYGGTGNDLVLQWAGTRPVAWGFNNFGQLGNNTATSFLTATEVDTTGALAGRTVTQIAAGENHNVALCSDGKLVSWGANGNGQLGNGSTADGAVPVLVEMSGVLAGKTVTAVAAGYFHSVALCSDGTVASWGYNFYGQLGNNSTTQSLVPVALNTAGVLAGKTVVAVAAGYEHTMALCSDGTLAAWGYNSQGQLGNNSTTSSSVPVVVVATGVLAGKTVISISTNYEHSVALCSDGTVASWGYNGQGQLGNNSTTNSSVPVAANTAGVLAGKVVGKVAAGLGHTLTLCADGTLVAWGSDSSGQLGNNSFTSSSVPVAVNIAGVLAGKTVAALSAGQLHSAALCSDGTLAVWGYNFHGELGNGGTNTSTVPVLVSTAGTALAGKTVVAVSLGFTHSLALCSDGTVTAWGYNGNGQLGSNGAVEGAVPMAVDTTGVLQGKTVVAMSSGGYHSVALCSDGTVASWGYNGQGQLGNNSTTNSSVPVAVTTTGTALAGKTVVAIGAGGNHSVALCADGTVAAWGSNSSGRLGNNSFTSSSVPVAVNTSGVLAGKVVVAIAAGASHNTALCSDGTLVAWGSNGNGQLGNSSTTQSPVPVAVNTAGVLAGKTVVAAAAGGSHSMALCSDGTLAAWGYSFYGQLGNNSTTQSTVPVAVSTSGVLAGRTATAITAGQYHSVALCADGALVAWGYNTYGQLGNNSFTNSSVPVAVNTSGVLAGKPVVAVSAGYYFNVAQCSDGTLVEWGNGTNGQLGNNSFANSSVPVAVNTSALAPEEVFVLGVSGQSAVHTLGLVAVPATAPIIAVQQSGGLVLSSGASVVYFGNTAAGVGVTQTFTIANNGSAPLLIASVTVDGANGSDFSVTTPPAAAVDVGASTTLVVSFAPAASLARSGMLHIVSNDPYVGSFDISLAGTGTVALAASYGSAGDVGLTAGGFNATGSTVSFALNYAPLPGTNLMVVQNTGPGFIQGVFSNLAQGQMVTLSRGGINYHFVANYYGGTGNDLVLQWADARPVAWGWNNLGQLGNGTATCYSALAGVDMTGVLAGKTVSAVSAGYSHSVALCTDGTLVAWGYNFYGQLGNNSTVQSNVPVLVDTTGALAGKTVKAVAAGYSHSLALCTDGTVVAWGLNSQGQLGNNSTAQSTVPVVVNTAGVLAGKTVTAVSAGYYHSLALCSDGTVAAWGLNSQGQLGNNGTTNSNVPVAVSTAGVLAGKTVVSVSTEYYHSIALCSDGTLAAWGYNNDGQLGNNSTINSSVPVAVITSGVLAGKTVTAVSAGYEHTLVLCSDGTMAGWGYNGFGQLGNNSFTNSSVPVAVSTAGALAGKVVTKMAAGYEHNLAVCFDGTTVGWGYGAYGQLGTGGFSSSSVPVVVGTVGTPLAGRTVAALSVGQYHSLVLCADGTAAACGYNSNGQLGSNGTVGTAVPLAVDISGVLAGRTVVMMAGGANHSVALCSDGTVATWGNNFNGQLGNGSTTNSSVPMAVTTSGVLAGRTVVAVSAGQSHCLALCADGTVASWGGNSSGQLGNGNTTQSTVPVAVNTAGVLAGRTVVAVAAAGNQNVVLCSNGTVAAWGYNFYGQLGNKSTTNSSVPVAVNLAGVLAGKTVTAIAAGMYHTAALCSDGTVAAWGYNIYGQLGNNSTTNSSVPVAVSTAGTALAGKAVAALSAGYYHCLVLCTDGTLAAWGYNSFGQLGTNNTTNSSVPVKVSTAGTVLAGRTVATVSAGQFHSMAKCSDGTLATWGSGGTGQLGNNGFINSNLPVAVSTASLAAEELFMSAVSGQTATHNLALVAAPPVAPIIGVQQPAGTMLTNGSSVVDFGGRALGTGVTQTFTITNNGSAPLAIASVTVDGANGSDFSVSTPPAATVNAGASTTMVVTFVPSASLARSGTLHIASNDPYAGSFDIRLAGTGALALTAAYATAGDVALAAPGFTATSSTVNFALNYAPLPGTNLMVVQNTAPGFIQGVFSNLAQGQVVTLSRGGISYRFVANYYGGTGNDLVLQWADVRPMSWGSNNFGQLGNAESSSYPSLVGVDMTGVLAGKVVTAVAAGYLHNVALCTDGTLVAWGYNLYGQLGNNGTTSSSAPVLVDMSAVLAGKTVKAVSAGTSHSMALCTDGTLVAWGYNNAGQLGNNSTTSSSVPVLVDMTGVLAGKTVISISAGYQHCLALCGDGTLVAWGYNGLGQLGNNSTVNSSAPVAVSTVGVLAGKTVTAVAAGYEHSMVLCQDGTLATWGYNFYGQLGNNTTTNSSVPVPVDMTGVLAGKAVVSISAGYEHCVALCGDGSVAAWGYNGLGQLGNSSFTSSSVPVAVNSTGELAGKVVTKITAGYGHNLAVCTDGSLVAWGYNIFGQLGNSSFANSNVPVLMGTIGTLLAGKTVTAVAAGQYQSVVLCSDSTLEACGTNMNGQLGNNGTTFTTAPAAVDVIGVLAGKSVLTMCAGEYHSVALCSDGTLAAWGSGLVGQLGNNSFTNSSVPVAVDMSGVLAGKTVVAVAAGYQHTVALCSDGTMAAWGFNNDGQLGNGSTANSSVPVAVSTAGALAGKKVVAVAAGFYHSLALCSDGTVSAWGYNTYGQLGNNSTTQSTVPVMVTTAGALAGKSVTAISAGYYHSVALCSDGTAAAWGYNTYGQLGNNSTANSSVPVAVSTAGALSGKAVVSICAGAYHCMALCADGSPTGWGYNNFGQLGNNSTSNSNVPVAVSSTGTALAGKKVVRVTAGYYDNVVLCEDGTAVAWGYNYYGQLGNTSTTHSSVPVMVSTSALAADERFMLVTSGPAALHSLGLVAAAPVAPIIAVEQPVGTPLVSSVSAVDFGSSAVGTAVTKTFSLMNHGSAALTITNVSIGGGNTDFAVTTAPAATVDAGTGTTLVVTFTPGAALARNAVLHIMNNDPYAGSFDVSLSGSGTSQLQSWRQIWYGTTANTGNAADTAVPLGDGISNLMKFATGMDPSKPGVVAINVKSSGSSLTLTYTRSKGALSDGVAFNVQWSDTLAAGSWSTANVSETSVVDQGATQLVTATAPIGSSGRRFMRLQVNGP